MQATNVQPAAEAAAATTLMTPEDGREYRVVLGRSLMQGTQQQQQQAAAHAPSASAVMRALRGDSMVMASVPKPREHDNASVGTSETVDEVFVSFRYEFQPASVDTRTPGLVTVDDSNGLQVLRGHSSGAPGGILFKGKMVENKEIDCLLLFDGAHFRLEKCPFAFTQLRHVRAKQQPAAKAPALTLSDGTAVGAACRRGVRVQDAAEDADADGAVGGE